ncbi:MAG: biotin/lipoyl-containing protein [Dehalococcoidia bacterium]
MAVSVCVPDLGEGMAGGLIAEWYHPDGATVATGELICRVEYEFVAFEVEAERPGLLRHSLPIGSFERAGGVLGLILEAEEVEGDITPGTEHPTQEPLAEKIAEERAPENDFEDQPVQDPGPDEPPVESAEPHFEAVVVPFKRRFTDAPAMEWDHAPGDEVDFESGFFSGKPEVVTERLAEPGGSIPGLALWENDEPSDDEERAPDPLNERYARISAQAAASAQVLTVTVGVDLGEAGKLAAACQRAWGPGVAEARTEDVVFRAIALALDEAGALPGPGALVIAETESDISSALAAPATMTLRDAVAAREAGGDAAFEDAEWTMVSLVNLGVAAASAHLEDGRAVSFALAAPNHPGIANLTMSYDSSRWSEGSAARLLSHVRELAETPYAMLV